MKEAGFLMLSRTFFRSEMWKAARTFSECEAWIDLIQSARFDATDQPTCECIGGRRITYGRGQYPASNRFLAKRWGWGEQKVKTFLARLKKQQMITICSNQGMNVITLCNYNRYNGSLKEKSPAIVENAKADANHTDNADIAQLISQLSQEVTQLKAHLAEKQPEGNPNSKKENKANPPIAPLAVEYERAMPLIPIHEVKQRLLEDQNWMAQACMQSTLSTRFMPILPRQIDHFLSWIQVIGEEHTIQTLADAKRRFIYWWKNHGKKEYEHTQESTCSPRTIAW